jgi:hypothetical protein
MENKALQRQVMKFVLHILNQTTTYYNIDVGSRVDLLKYCQKRKGRISAVTANPAIFVSQYFDTQ